MRLPCMSVMVTCVLLNVARMLAMPETMFLASLALMIFLPAASSPNSSAARQHGGRRGASAGLARRQPVLRRRARLSRLLRSLLFRRFRVRLVGGFAAASAGFASFSFFGAAGFFFVSSAIVEFQIVNRKSESQIHQWMPVLAFGLRCTPTVLRGPLRVRALVCVRWPRTGRPRKWRMPR